MIRHTKKSERSYTPIFRVQKKAPMLKRLPNRKPSIDADRKPLRRSAKRRGARPNQAQNPASSGGNEILTKREEATVNKKRTLFLIVTSSEIIIRCLSPAISPPLRNQTLSNPCRWRRPRGPNPYNSNSS